MLKFVKIDLIFIFDKCKKKITFIKAGIKFRDSLQIVETEKLRKYDLLANELDLIYKCPNAEDSWERASMGIV
ncbi:hypothetical protein CWI38_1540p0030 [Hamiltosporidium tvaerminnensis]|uniref:Uncharacterized protein n=1 Tax=Hamiltosporidium tvaerminnensis TaxID=1176355 RepID=A0A4Q9LRB4_9MICR|nr:hypothetical protein CWI38_1540p0030 [Hamiltosporidium tvaerminnensis]